MQPVVIRRSWTAVGLAVVVSGLPAVGIWAVSLGALSFYEAIPFEVRAPVAITFAGVFWLWLLRHLSPTKPALVIDDRGLVDQASNYEVGLIPWSEIRGAEIVWRTRKGGEQKVLAISVRDLTPFMARVGIITRTMMRLEQWLSGSVIDIPQWSLRTPVEEVLSALQQHRRLVRCSSLGAVPARAVSWPESTPLLGPSPPDRADWRSRGLTVGAVLLLSLALYGAYAWYFPTAAFATVAAMPAVAVALAGAHRLRLWSLSKLACVFGVPLGAVLVWSACVQGVPAVVTYVLGAYGAEVAVIGAKNMTPNRGVFCAYQLGLVGYTSVGKETLCVPRALWNQVVVGQRVEIWLRKDIFGTRIFAIRLPPQR